MRGTIVFVSDKNNKDNEKMFRAILGEDKKIYTFIEKFALQSELSFSDLKFGDQVEFEPYDANHILNGSLKKIEEKVDTPTKTVAAPIEKVTSNKSTKYPSNGKSFYSIGHLMFKDAKEANDFVDRLAKDAMKENWDWRDPEIQRENVHKPILRNYLEKTYDRLLDENNKKIYHYKGKKSESKVCFNSGLLNQYFRQIFIVGTEDKSGEGFIKDLNFYTEKEHEISQIPKEERPKMASYFSDVKDVVFDASLEIQLNDAHVFEDGLKNNRLKKYTDEYKKKEKENDHEEKESFLLDIKEKFEAAIKRAILLTERNYKLVAPMYYSKYKKLQFLLPIYLNAKNNKPDCALVLDYVKADNENTSSYYKGSTILTLDMAYNDARLIAKPEVSWLDDVTKK